MKKISVAIITKNEEANIERTLKSILWADEILIVDCFSTDNTKAIAKKYNVTFIEKEWENFSIQKKYALDKTTNEWVLSLDADEVVTEELKIEIQNLLNEDPKFDGYFIPRKNYFLGKWIKNCGWYPDYQLRLGKKSKLFVTDKKVHESFEVEGGKGFLTSPLNHYSYNTIHQYFEKFNTYTTLDVEQKIIKKGKNISFLNFIFNPLAQFIRMYFVKNGWKDGLHGFLVSIFSSYYTLVVYAKGWEKINSEK